jgi:hypothetical protein
LLLLNFVKLIVSKCPFFQFVRVQEFGRLAPIRSIFELDLPSSFQCQNPLCECKQLAAAATSSKLEKENEEEEEWEGEELINKEGEEPNFNAGGGTFPASTSFDSSSAGGGGGTGGGGDLFFAAAGATTTTGTSSKSDSGGDFHHLLLLTSRDDPLLEVRL